MRFFIVDPGNTLQELTSYEDRDVELGDVPAASDLGNAVGSYRITVADVPAGLIPILNEPELAHGFGFRVTEDDGTTITFRGRVEEVTLALATG